MLLKVHIAEADYERLDKLKRMTDLITEVNIWHTFSFILKDILYIIIYKLMATNNN